MNATLRRLAARCHALRGGLLAALCLLVALPAQAVNYTFPGNMPTGCTGSNGNAGGNASDLTLIVQGVLTVGYQAVVNANISATSSGSTVTVGYGARVVGAINASGNVSLAQNARASSTIDSSLDFALNLGATPTDQSCLAAHPASTAANLPWLRSQNGSSGACGTAWDRDPSARATFSIFSPETRRTVHVRALF